MPIPSALVRWRPAALASCSPVSGQVRARCDETAVDKGATENVFLATSV